MPSTTRQSLDPRMTCTNSAPPGRTVPAARPTPARRLTRTPPTCTTSTGFTVELCPTNARSTLSRTPASTSVRPTWGHGLTRWTRAGAKSGSWTSLCAKRIVSSGGKTASTTTRARRTGMSDGTGPQGRTSAPWAPCANRGRGSFLSRKTCVRRSGATPTNIPPGQEAAGAASRCGLMPQKATPMWPSPSITPTGGRPRRLAFWGWLLRCSGRHSWPYSELGMGGFLLPGLLACKKRMGRRLLPQGSPRVRPACPLQPGGE